MTSNTVPLRELLVEMRSAYGRGENAMARARAMTNEQENNPAATLIAYDLQAGSYVEGVRARPEAAARWSEQLVRLLAPFVTADSSLLEVGCGEATTLAGVLDHLPTPPAAASGFDLSWSRCAVGIDWLRAKKRKADLFVADLFSIPLADASIDVVYTSHSLEPNGGREEEAICELLRVARRAVVLVEPIYELASEAAQARMRTHGYVRGLKATSERLGAKVAEYRLLSEVGNPLNPSGVLILPKASVSAASPADMIWRCPLTHTPLRHLGDCFFASEAGLAYPILRSIPLLRAEHAIVANRLETPLADVRAANGPQESAVRITL